MSKNRNSVRIVISGHKLEDREYLIGRVRPMFADLFAIPLRVHILNDENTMVLCAYSKRVALTLYQWGMPFGHKKLSRLTPDAALDEVSFVRGLFDMDGCVNCKYGPYMQIQFKSASRSLLVYVKECLVKLGFHPTSITSDDTKFRFFLSRQGEVDRFFSVINPKNPKHLKRFHSASRKQSFRSYTHRSEQRPHLEPTKAYRNNFLTTHSVGQPREPFESRGRSLARDDTGSAGLLASQL